MPSVSIFGIGRMGGALAIALAKAGYEVEYLIHRGSETVNRITEVLPSRSSVAASTEIPVLSSDIILITTTDPEIEAAAAQLAPLVTNKAVALHTSGSLSSEVLSILSDRGCSTGSMHPLVSISDAMSGSASFSDVYFCIEGDARASAAASQMAEALGGRPFSIESELKPLYHAAAVTAAGHVTALFDVAIEMLTECGVDGQTAQRVLLPLIKSTVANLETQTTVDALTGTFARADVSAFERHLNAMETAVPDAIRQIYIALAERSIELAAKRGHNADGLAKLRKAISVAKRKSEC